jgi:hypothetical protein
VKERGKLDHSQMLNAIQVVIQEGPVLSYLDMD